jgi:DNA-directed RNA polymerase specialized sigma24 family protein
MDRVSASKPETCDATIAVPNLLDAIAGVDRQLRAYLGTAVKAEDERTEILHDAIAEAWCQLSVGLPMLVATTAAISFARRSASAWKQRGRHEVRATDLMIHQCGEAPDQSVGRTHRLRLWTYEEAMLLGHLTPSQRAALELHVMDSLPDKEIAARVGCSEKSVRTLRRVACRRLRLLLERGLVPPPPE